MLGQEEDERQALAEQAPLRMRLLHRDCMELDKRMQLFQQESSLLNQGGVDEWLAMARETCLIV